MPPPTINRVKIDRKGLVEFQLGDAPVFVVDLFLFNNEWVQVDQQYRDGTGQELPHYIDLVKKYGGPPDTTGEEALAIVTKVAELCGGEKKSTEPAASSAGATTSTPGPSNPGKSE